MTARRVKPLTTFTVEAEAEVTHDDLHDAGWHHEDECPAKFGSTPLSLTEALRDLHLQAHPGEPSDPLACRQKPCVSLSLAQITGKPVAA